MTQLFTIDPNPICAGQPFKLCWTGPLPATCKYRINPPGTWVEVTFTDAKKCVTINAPANGITFVAVGPGSDDLTSPIVDCAAPPISKNKPPKKPKK